MRHKTDLALTLSNRQESQEFHVLLIIIILVTTIFFCHSIISLCLLVISPSEDVRPRMSMVGPGGFANPPYPIPVAMARDEEAAGIESEITKYPPPAYGLWRESVVCSIALGQREKPGTNKFIEGGPESNILATERSSKFACASTADRPRGRGRS